MCSKPVSLPARSFFCFLLLLLQGFLLKTNLNLAELMTKSMCGSLAKGGGRQDHLLNLQSLMQDENSVPCSESIKEVTALLAELNLCSLPSEPGALGVHPLVAGHRSCQPEERTRVEPRETVLVFCMSHGDACFRS